ncbi:MAG TPA: 50S ribosomal protein L13 [Bacteroidia bacterium]|nr:50S ribosomal protein L13 [Bacteroidia bacterium]
MNTPSYKTSHLNNETVKKNWFIVDAENQIAGRLASEVAKILRGKHKASFSPHVDCGDNVVIVNAEKVKFTGKKTDDKQYVRYTGYPGGQRFSTPRKLLEKNPTQILRHAIKGMLPKNKLGSVLQTNVFIYAGNKHPHEAQQPKELKFNS